jgi:hypothetical protein
MVAVCDGQAITQGSKAAAETLNKNGPMLKQRLSNALARPMIFLQIIQSFYMEEINVSA